MTYDITQAEKKRVCRFYYKASPPFSFELRRKPSGFEIEMWECVGDKRITFTGKSVRDLGSRVVKTSVDWNGPPWVPGLSGSFRPKKYFRENVRRIIDNDPEILFQFIHSSRICNAERPKFRPGYFSVVGIIRAALKQTGIYGNRQYSLFSI